MGAPTTRTRILKIWSTTYGLTLTPEALSWLEALVNQFGLANTADEKAVKNFHEAMEKMAKSHTEDTEDYSQIVTADHLEVIYARLQALEGNDADAEHDGRNGTAEDANNIDPSTHIRIIDAFDMPWLHFDGEKRTFVHHANIASTSGNAAGTSAARKLPSIGAAADSKAAYLRDRYNILKQIILRNEHFSPPALPGHDRENYMKLTSIKNLLGRQGGHFLLFGMLTRLEDGAFALEDLDAQIVLDISEASPASGMFTEGCFALVDGQYTLDSIFKVSEIGHPPSETRAISRSIYGHIDFLGTGALTLSEEEKLRESETKHPDQFLVFSDLHLDSPKDLSHFRKVLQAYESFLGDRPPALCIICGNFASKPVKLMDGKSLKEYQNNFSAFGDLILSYPRCARDMHFVFVPGPTDPYDVTGAILPRRGLPKSLVKDVKAKLPKVSFPSNPCRITYKSQEIVVMREDLMSRMLRNTVRLKADLATLANQQLAEEETMEGAVPLAKGDGRRKILSQFLVQTILDQSHLAPFPLSVRPVLWEFDQALRLFPLPTTVILADKYLPYEVTYEDCHVFNPGGFAGSNYTWSAYQTGDRRSEQSGFE